MNFIQKIRIYILAAVTLSLLPLLSSCETGISDSFGELRDFAAQQVSLVKNEYSDILEFFDEEYLPTGEFGTLPKAASARPDAEIMPTLVSTHHTELIETVYNKAEDGLKIYNPGDPEKVYTRNTVPVTDSEKLGYTAVPRFDDPNLAEVIAIFASAGITPSVEYRTNPAPAGDVFALSFAGLSDDSAFYINSAAGVKLYVSDRKLAVMESDLTKNNIVYLTYDDGPTAANTTALLDILDSYGVKASFFLMGQSIQKYPDAAEEIVLRGHGIGCHSVTHQYAKLYASAETLEDEIAEWEEIVEWAGITLPHKMFRYPGGSVGTYLTPVKKSAMMNMLDRRGYKVFDWNVVTNDSILYMREDGEYTYDYIKENFISTFEKCIRENKGKDGEPIIILMHETVEETVNLTAWMIEYLVERGFTFGALQDLEESWIFS